MVPEAAATPQLGRGGGRLGSAQHAAPAAAGGSIADHLTPQQLAACPHRYLDPITLDVMADPVLLSHTGQVYDYPSLITWFESGGRTCPMTGLPLSGKVTLRVDTELRKEILIWLRAQGLDAETARAAALRGRHNTDDHGEKGALSHRQRNRHMRRFKAALAAVGSFLTSSTKFYGDIY